MAKGLFTTSEEIDFQYNYVQGNVQKNYDPNTRRSPEKGKYLCSNKKLRKNPRTYFGRSR